MVTSCASLEIIEDYDVNQLRIRNCKLRLVRKGGWSWGADPNRLVRMATQSLPELIAQKLRQLLLDREEHVTISHLSVNVPVKLSELNVMTFESNKDIGHSILSDRISLVFKQALAAQAGIDESPADEPAYLDQTDKSLRRMPAYGAKNDVISLIVKWYEQGKLLQLLKHFSDQALGAWEKLILKSLAERGATPKNDSEDFLTKPDQFSNAVLQSLKEQKRVGVKRLILLAALLQRYQNRLSQEITAKVLNKYIPADTDSIIAAEPGGGNGNDAMVSAESTDTAIRSKRQPSIRKHTTASVVDKRRPAEGFELNVSSVLPFVAVGILSRFGYFDVLSTALNAEGMERDISYFVVALAYKMLPALHRGTYREARDMQTAAAAAGLNQSVSGEELDRFAFSCVNSLSPLDGCLKLLLTEGHDPSRALLIHRLTIADKPSWLLMDTQGCFPIGWFLNDETMFQALNDFSGNTFLISDVAAEPSLFSALTLRRHRFITSLPPGRQDNWRSIDRKRRWWTNDLDAQTGWLRNQSQCLQVVTESAERVSRELLADRSVLPQSQKGYVIQFEQSLALTAASALSTIAWQLWGENEMTDAVLALERLGNLEGKVLMDKEKMTVRPALGRRYLDLYHNNFLVDVVNVPWLGGRRLEFAGL